MTCSALCCPPAVPACRGAARAEEGREAHKGCSQAQRPRVGQGTWLLILVPSRVAHPLPHCCFLPPVRSPPCFRARHAACLCVCAHLFSPAVARRPQTPTRHACPQIIAKEVVNMRRTVAKLAMNKATFLALSNQMTEQLGAAGLGGSSVSLPARWPCLPGVHAPLLLLPLPPGSHRIDCPGRAPSLSSVLPPRHPAAMTRVAGSLAKSGEVMKLVNNLMKVPQLHKTMVEMSRGGAAAAEAWCYSDFSCCSSCCCTTADAYGAPLPATLLRRGAAAGQALLSLSDFSCCCHTCCCRAAAAAAPLLTCMPTPLPAILAAVPCCRPGCTALPGCGLLDQHTLTGGTCASSTSAGRAMARSAPPAAARPCRDGQGGHH